MLREYEGEMMIFNTARSRALETAILQEVYLAYITLKRLVQHELWSKGSALVVKCSQAVAFWVDEHTCANEECVLCAMLDRNRLF